MQCPIPGSYRYHGKAVGITLLRCMCASSIIHQRTLTKALTKGVPSALKKVIAEILNEPGAIMEKLHNIPLQPINTSIHLISTLPSHSKFDLQVDGA